MRTRYRIFLVLMLVQAAWCCAAATDARAEVKRLQDYFKTTGYIACKIKTLYYRDASIPIAFDSSVIDFVFGGRSMYYGNKEMEVFAIDSYFVQINKKSKEVFVKNWKYQENLLQYGLSWLDTLLKSNRATISVTELKNGTNLLMIKSQSGGQTTYKIWYERVAGKINRIDIESATQFDSRSGKVSKRGLVRMNYEGLVQSQSPFPRAKHHYTKYLSVKGRNVVLKEAYKNYTVNNYLIKPIP